MQCENQWEDFVSMRHPNPLSITFVQLKETFT
jgi:hypothetical protein